MLLIDGIRIPILIIIGGMILGVAGYLGMHFAQLDATSLIYPVLLPEGIPLYVISTIFKFLSIVVFFWGGIQVMTGGLMLAAYYHRGRRPHFVIVFPFNNSAKKSLQEIARRYAKELGWYDEE